MAKPLTTATIAQRLEGLPGWKLAENQIEREYRFRNFSEAFAFMTMCALEAEKINHHPDWSNTWATVRVRLSTHDAGGITDLDFQLATRMEVLASRFLSPPA